ncbi:MAG: hypothetical protein MK213_06980 [Planctomycetes bacterium]|nr:hypothetical protein [Planctomycetota bacterium]
MFSIAFTLLLCPQSSEREEAWASARALLSETQQVGFDFLLEHMPASDQESLNPDDVLSDIRLAYQAWEQAPWSASVPQHVFLNEVLPYASVNEKRESWRKEFFERFSPLIAEAKTASEAAVILNQSVFPELKVIYSTKRPKADQSPQESIAAGMASCTGLSILLVDACRAVGVPARFVGTPLWADGSGNHSWVEIWDDGWHFTGAAEPTGNALNRAWFSDRAAQAVEGDSERAIFAVSYKKTPLAFPMVWAPENTEISAVDVTRRYGASLPVAQGQGRLRVAVFGPSGDRLEAGVKVSDPNGKVHFEGKTKDERYDSNDHWTQSFALGAILRVEVNVGEVQLMESIVLAEDDSLLRCQWGQEPSMELQTVRDQLWEEHVARLKSTRAAEMEARVISDAGVEMPFWYRSFGERPDNGHSLWISMHGGGGTTSEVNDQQWENQKRLYSLEEGIYLAPRAPTNTWNLWHQAHIDDCFERLIENMIVFEGVDPDRVYLLGYSAGGDGVYQLAPRMADRFAAAGMMAGHPNETVPDGLRNLPFTLHMGGLDRAYDRNKIAAAWKEKLLALHEGDSDGYVHWVEIYPEKGHWMDREDGQALEWMAERTREPRPQKVVWVQDDVTHERFYWLSTRNPIPRSRLEVDHHGNVFKVLDAKGVKEFSISVDASMVDFSQPIVVTQEGVVLWEGTLTPSLRVMKETLAGQGDPRGIYQARTPSLALEPNR